MIYVSKRAFFTLLETLVVFLILSMGLSLTGVKFYQAYQEQKVYSDIQQVLDHLLLAQDLMLLMDAEAEVILKHVDKTVTCQVLVEKPLTKDWQKVVEREVTLSSIKHFQLGRIPENPLRIRFSLGDMTEGTLLLSAKDSLATFNNKNDVFAIALPGYPSPIELSDPQVMEREHYSDDEQLFPIDVKDDLQEDKKVSV